MYLGVDITKRVDDSIHRIFMDPTARHLIVCMKSQESFYLARNSKKPKPLAKMKVPVLKNSFSALLIFLLFFLHELFITFSDIYTVKPLISNHPKCQALVVA